MFTHTRSMIVGGYSHNFDDFCKYFTYPRSINKGKKTTLEGAYMSLV